MSPSGQDLWYSIARTRLGLHINKEQDMTFRMKFSTRYDLQDDSLSGDVCPNPGPVKNPCTVCFRPVAKNHRAVSCDGCYGYSHIKCEGLSYSFYKDLCKLQSLPKVVGTPIQF